MRGGLPALLCCLAIPFAVFVFLPASLAPLENFDSPKRVVLALLAVALLALPRRWAAAAAGRTWLLAPLIAWMALRAALRPDPLCELPVLAAWLLSPVLYLAARRIRASRDSLGVVLLLTAVLQTGLMILQRLGLDPLFAETTAALPVPAERMIGTVGYQNQAAAVIALTGGAGICLLARRFLAAALLPLPALVALTGSRGVTLATVAAVAVAVAVDQRRRARPRRAWAAAALMLVLGAAITLAVPVLRERMAAAGHSAAVDQRVRFARIGLEMFRERPFVGWGPGAFAFQFIDRLPHTLPATLSQPIMDTVVYAREMHNDYLDFAASFGLLGVALAALALAGIVRDARDGAPHAGRPAAGFVLVCVAVDALVSFPMQMALPGPLAALLLGLALGLGGPPPSPCSDPATVRTRLAGAGRAGALLLALGVSAFFGLIATLDLVTPRVIETGRHLDSARLHRAALAGGRHAALLGAALVRSGQKEAGDALLEKAAERYRDPALYRNLGHLHATRNDWTGALEWYRTLARSGLLHRDALLDLSVALENLGQPGAAADVLATRAGLWPDWSRDAIIRRCVLLMKDGRMEVGLHLLKAYERRQTQPTAAIVDNLHGALLLTQRDARGAIPWFRKALAKDSGLASAQSNLASAEAALGR